VEVQVRLVKDGCDGELRVSASGLALISPPGGSYYVPEGPVNSIYSFWFIDPETMV